ncbi:hypothetical protein COK77_08060 [Bacillus cereus]|uniref:hypothetical protein n=1 Tax=Bacillus cereus TaxID=1396 RepID=UPI000BF7B634|nr:hypothetical protein [Bacillus cereus]PFU17501.1 hypothetical protein COK77_08060 [Bacillus cereus]PFU19505.1 hypothetical protein COK76_30795 [Bacillus cereus]PGP57648.1 hypothetical protein COA04_29580 [Bacillus cereus]HDR7992624.1 hypothetical protein [Bacillus cereus]
MNKREEQTNYQMRITPPDPFIVRYFNYLKDQNLAKWIADNCNSQHLPHVPPVSCTFLPSGGKFCSCCKGNWSIVIFTTEASQYIPLLVGITEINPSGGIVTGYVYPDLDNEQYIMAVVHIGCIYH